MQPKAELVSLSQMECFKLHCSNHRYSALGRIKKDLVKVHKIASLHKETTGPQSSKRKFHQMQHTLKSGKDQGGNHELV